MLAPNDPNPQKTIYEVSDWVQRALNTQGWSKINQNSTFNCVCKDVPNTQCPFSSERKRVELSGATAMYTTLMCSDGTIKLSPGASMHSREVAIEALREYMMFALIDLKTQELLKMMSEDEPDFGPETTTELAEAAGAAGAAPPTANSPSEAETTSATESAAQSAPNSTTESAAQSAASSAPESAAGSAPQSTTDSATGSAPQSPAGSNAESDHGSTTGESASRPSEESAESKASDKPSTETSAEPAAQTGAEYANEATASMEMKSNPTEGLPNATHSLLLTFPLMCITSKSDEEKN